MTHSGGVTHYVNNGLNQRVRKSGAGPIGNVSYVHDSNGLLLGETGHNGTTISTQYIWLGGELLGVVRHNVLYYAHTDHLGRAEAITDQNQSIVWRADLTAYNQVPKMDTFGGLHLRFPGQYFDPESDLWYNWHRYYDASTGRYVQSDPIGLLGGSNSYAYVEGNPISYVDPTGEVPLPLLALVGTAAINALRVAATQAIKCGTKGGGKLHGHHSDPKFLGGDPKQPLTTLDGKTHRALHKDMNDFLRTKTDEFGNHMRPQRGNSGERIQQNFTRDQCIGALCEFYRGPGAKYEDATKDFFKQHPGR